MSYTSKSETYLNQGVPAREAKLPLRKQILEYIRRLDQYGHRVHLNYNGGETFKTVFGGTFTLFSRFIFIVYLSFLCNIVFTRSGPHITEKFQYRNLLSDQELIKVTPENFELSILIQYSPDRRMIKVDNIFQYFTVKMAQVTQRIHTISNEHPDGIERIFEYKKLQFCQLGQQSMGEIEYKRFNQNISLCIPQNTTLFLRGLNGNDEQKYFQFQVTYCDQSFLDDNFPGQICKNATESDAIVNNVVGYYFSKFQYFDAQDYSGHPIKYSNDARRLNLQRQQKQAIINKVSSNYAYLKDNIFGNFISPKNLTYFQSKWESVSFFDNEITYFAKGQFLILNYMLDEKITTVVRQSYSLFEAVGQAGGLMGVIYQIFNFFIIGIQAFIFNKTMARQIFLVPDFERKKNSNKKKLQQIKQENGNFQPRQEGFRAPQMNQNNDIKMIVTQLVQSLWYRKPLKYQFKDLLKSKIIKMCPRRLCCIRQNRQQVMLDQHYENSIIHLTKTLDIRNLFKAVKRIEAMFTILLNKRQHKLMTFFDSQLTIGDQKIDGNQSTSYQETHKQKNTLEYRGELLSIQTSLRQLIEKTQNKENAVDIRIYRKIAQQEKNIQQILEQNRHTGQEEEEDSTEKQDPSRKTSLFKVFDEDQSNNFNPIFEQSQPNLNFIKNSVKNHDKPVPSLQLNTNKMLAKQKTKKKPEQPKTLSEVFNDQV